LVVAVIVSLGCGLLFGGFFGYLLGRSTTGADDLDYYPPRQERPSMPERPGQPEVLPQVPEFEYGARVVMVVENSPAERANLRAGDIIVAVSGEPVRPERPLTEIIRSYEPGDRVELTVWRQTEGLLELPVRLGKRMSEDGQTIAHLGVRVMTLRRTPAD
jgi:S1-C subfamily serine protease